MNYALNNTTTNPSVTDGFIESEQLDLFARYTCNYVGGDHIDTIKYVSFSKGKTDIKSWTQKYLSQDKEELYIRALRNLFRKLDFIELNQSLEMEDISEEDYDKELSENEKKYLIPAPDVEPTVQQVIQIVDIIKRLGRENSMTVDEVSEMFSLNMDKSIAVLQN
jgi:hypothetical protein